MAILKSRRRLRIYCFKLGTLLPQNKNKNKKHPCVQLRSGEGVLDIREAVTRLWLKFLLADTLCLSVLPFMPLPF